jgi:hypothetical protein
MRCLRLGPADQPHDDNDDDDENNDAAEREDHGDSAPFTLGQSSGALGGTRTPDDPAPEAGALSTELRAHGGGTWGRTRDAESGGFTVHGAAVAHFRHTFRGYPDALLPAGTVRSFGYETRAVG